MQHILDNPIWNALTSGNAEMAQRHGDASYIKRDAGLFAGMKNNSAEEFDELWRAMPSKSPIILFTPHRIDVPDSWVIKMRRPVFQMIYPAEQITAVDTTDIISLGDKDITSMTELIQSTNPGPFYPRTIDFGNYEGIFHGDQLISMTGQRLQPYNYCEVSAVCTHPDHTGKGYAARLLRNQLNRIVSANQIPFLNVYPENEAACKLYWKLGFETRKEMVVYFLERDT